MNSLLRGILGYGVIVNKLRRFVADVMDTMSDIVYSRTYEAFAMALTSYLQTLSRNLSELESIIAKQGECIFIYK